jgi:hypothetical protein
LSKRNAPDRTSPEWKLTEHITKFANVAYERRLRPSRALYDAICSAKESGYSDDEMRMAFWVARTVRLSEADMIGGVAWLKTSLMAHGSMELVLRHKAGLNPATGVPAKRWLDELLSRIDETNPNVIRAILLQLPEEMQAGEEGLFKRMEVEYSREARRPKQP